MDSCSYSCTHKQDLPHESKVKRVKSTVKILFISTLGPFGVSLAALGHTFRHAHDVTIAFCTCFFTRNDLLLGPTCTKLAALGHTFRHKHDLTCESICRNSRLSGLKCQSKCTNWAQPHTHFGAILGVRSACLLVMWDFRSKIR